MLLIYLAGMSIYPNINTPSFEEREVLIGATCGAGHANPTGAPGVTSSFLRWFMFIMTCIFVMFPNYLCLSRPFAF